MAASPGGLLIIFVSLWWLFFYLFLPIKTQVPSKQQEGHAASSPSRHYLVFKAIGATVVSILFTILYYYLVKEGILSANLLKPKDLPY